jgi:hypothetical protein
MPVASPADPQVNGQGPDAASVDKTLARAIQTGLTDRYALQKFRLMGRDDEVDNLLLHRDGDSQEAELIPQTQTFTEGHRGNTEPHFQDRTSQGFRHTPLDNAAQHAVVPGDAGFLRPR